MKQQLFGRFLLATQISRIEMMECLAQALPVSGQVPDLFDSCLTKLVIGVRAKEEALKKEGQNIRG